MPERFSPAQPNYLRFVSTPTIDIEPFLCLLQLGKNFIIYEKPIDKPGI